MHIQNPKSLVGFQKFGVPKDDVLSAWTRINTSEQIHLAALNAHQTMCNMTIHDMAETILSQLISKIVNNIEQSDTAWSLLNPLLGKSVKKILLGHSLEKIESNEFLNLPVETIITTYGGAENFAELVNTAWGWPKGDYTGNPPSTALARITPCERTTAEGVDMIVFFFEIFPD